MSVQKDSSMICRANSLRLRLGYAGYTTVDTRWKTESLATPFSRLYIIDKGNGVLSAGDQKVILEPGKAYLLPAGLPCSYCCEESLSLLFFHFDLVQEGGRDLLANLTCLPVTDYGPQRIAVLRDACEATGNSSALQVVCALQSLLLEMSEAYPFCWDAVPDYSKCVATAIRQIRQNLSAQLRIEDLAKSQFISRSYLSRQFREEVGVPIKQYIHMQLINTAQWQLVNTDASIERVSADLGFCNQFYFSEFFKKRCRVSPLQYRNGTKY